MPDQLDLEFTQAVGYALAKQAPVGSRDSDQWWSHVSRLLQENGAAPSTEILARMGLLPEAEPPYTVPAELASGLVEQADATEKGQVYEAIRGKKLTLQAVRLAVHGTPHYHKGEPEAQIGDEGLELLLLLDGEAVVWETRDGTDPADGMWNSTHSVWLGPGNMYVGHPNKGHFIERRSRDKLLAALVCPPSHMDKDQNYHIIDPPPGF